MGDRPTPSISRNPSRARGELVHPAVTPVADVPPPPPSLKPMPCPNGYGPLPAVFRSWKLKASYWSFASFLADQVVTTGHPCFFARTPELMAKIRDSELGVPYGDRSIELAIAFFARKGAITVNRRIFRGEEYTFLWINWALRDELPELGCAPDRDDPGCTAPHRPAFLLPGRPGMAAAQPSAPEKSCAMGPEPTASGIPMAQDFSPIRGAESSQPSQDRAGCCAIEPTREPIAEEFCAIEPSPGQGIASVPPGLFSGRTNVNVLSSSPPDFNSNTSTLVATPPASASEPTGFEGMPDAEVYAYLAPRHVFKSPITYTGAIRELTARQLPLPERYVGLPLFVTPPPEPKPEVKRYAPLPPEPRKYEPAPTLEQRIRRMAGGGDLTEATELADWMFKTVGEVDGNRVSMRFHRRNMREVAAGDMKPEALIDALKTFRAKTAEFPLKALCTEITTWRKDHGLAGKIYRGPRKSRAAKSAPSREARS